MDDERTILVVDDDPNLREIVSFTLKKSGFAIEVAKDGAEGLQQFADVQPDLIVLDVMMPKLDGLEVCKAIRQTSTVPIIFLTSVDEEIDRIIGLEIGGDDYLTKPFSPRELAARVKALLRRSELGREQETSSDSALEFGIVKVDRENFTVTVSSKEIGLTAIEFRMLEAMIRFPNKVFERDSLMAHAYDDNTVVSHRTIDSHIRKIRQKFSLHSVDPFETVHGTGYRMNKKLCQN